MHIYTGVWLMDGGGRLKVYLFISWLCKLLILKGLKVWWKKHQFEAKPRRMVILRMYTHVTHRVIHRFCGLFLQSRMRYSVAHCQPVLYCVLSDNLGCIYRVLKYFLLLIACSIQAGKTMQSHRLIASCSESAENPRSYGRGFKW